jgi:hypothetical protein
MPMPIDGLLRLLKEPDVQSVLICTGAVPLVERGSLHPAPGGVPFAPADFGLLIQEILSQKQQAQLAMGEPVVVERPVPEVGTVRFAVAADGVNHMLELRVATTPEIHIETPAISPTLTPHCPVCRHHCTDAGTDLACPRCHTLHHLDCWNYNGGCGLYGCTPTASPKPLPPPRPAPAPPPETPTISPNFNQTLTAVRLALLVVLPIYVNYQFWNVSQIVAENTAKPSDFPWMVPVVMGAGAILALIVVLHRRGIRLKLGPTPQFLLGTVMVGGALFGLHAQRDWILSTLSNPAGASRTEGLGVVLGLVFLALCGLPLLVRGWQRAGED